MSKQKQKSHSWAKKRLKKTKSWKIVFTKSCNNHLLTNKKKKTNKSFPYWKIAPKHLEKKLRSLIPSA